MKIDTADEIKRKFLGVPVKLRVKYVYHKEIKGTRLYPAEPAFVEIISITTQAFSPSWTANKEWIVVPASRAEQEEIADEILEGLL